MSTNVFDLSKYSVREMATVTLDCARQKNAYFSPPANDAIELYASIYPNGHATVAPETVPLFLRAPKMDRTELLVYFAVSLLDAKGERRFIKGFDWTFTEHGQSFNLPIISLHQLANLAHQLMPNGHMKVVVEASILEEKSILITSAPSFSFSDDLESLLQTSKFADVVLIVKGTKEFKAHKAILSARSPVLAAMFEHDCAESRQNRVEIPDVEVEVFEEMLRFLYTNRVHLLEQYAAELYLAADKYQVESLKRLCEQALLDAISADTFAKLIAFADSYDITELQQHCFAFFADHHKEITAIEDWSGPLCLKVNIVSKLVEQLSALLAKK